ncbi:dihydrolipoyl dehydrogenase [Wukongibacter sp. M2B1]|uniref:dihydrolipoyl dehydrogenase n=1 Tax=Wukongibacter sp. M2B1 TaxID=3088895 RepID=UPI003D7A1131
MKVVVLGGGPGGYVCGIRAAQLGADVTIIEKENMGGTCLNVGCIPTKVLLHTTELYRTLKEESKELGIKVDNLDIDWTVLQKRKQSVVNQLVDGVDTLLKSNNISKISGEGRFISENEIRVTLASGKKETIRFDKAVIATGSEPTIIPLEGVELDGVITSNEALSLKEIPENMCIIGGGVIGSEFASVYSSIGTKVTIIEMLPDILPTMDEDIVNILKNHLTQAGVDIYTKTKVDGIQQHNDKLIVNTSCGENKQSFIVEKVLLAAGRKPATKNLGLEEIGIKADRGAIVVDRRTMETNIKNIYAIGDCNGGILLAHVASAEGIVAAESIMGKASKIKFNTTPYAVYTKPELAAVGITEKEAKNKGYEVRVGEFPLYANGKSLIMGESNGLVKFVADAKTDEILGIHMAGPRATDLIVEGALALRLEATVEEIITTIHAHPTVGEALHEAAHSVHRLAIHLPR